MSNNDLTLGQKISNFRKRAGMSQLDLELEIGAGQGSLSRIENGQVNPTKETIIAISKVLNLTDDQIGNLFSINLGNNLSIIDVISIFDSAQDTSKVIQTAINKIAEHLNYINVSVYFIKGDTLYAQYINENILVNTALKLLPVRFNQLVLKITENSQNYMLRSALDGKPFESDDLADYARDVFDPNIARVMQKITKMRKGIAIPLSYNGFSIGTMFFTKEEADSYESELPILQAFARQIAVVLILEKFQNDFEKYGK